VSLDKITDSTETELTGIALALEKCYRPVYFWYCGWLDEHCYSHRL